MTKKGKRAALVQRTEQITDLQLENEQLKARLAECERKGGALGPPGREPSAAYTGPAVDAFIICDSQLMVTDVDEAALRYFGPGLHKEDVIGKGLADLVTDGERYKRYLKVVETGERFTVEESLVLPDVGEVQVVTRAFRVSGGLGILISDLTAQKRMETEAKRSQELLRAFMDSAADSFTIYDSHLNLVDVNETALRYLGPGVRREDVIGKNLADFIPDPKRHAPYIKVMETGEPLTSEETFVLPTAGEFTVTTHTFKVGDGIGIVTSDVTAQRRIEKELRQSEQRYRLLAENASDVIWTTDMDLTITYMSPAVTRLLGCTMEEAMKLTVADMLTPESADLGIKAFREQLVLEAREGTRERREWTMELQMRRRDGSTFWVEERVNFIRDAESRITGLMGITRDITDRKKAEEELRRSEERSRLLLEHANEGITVVQDGVLKYANPKLAEQAGYSVAELMSKPFTDLIHPDDLPKAAESYAKRIRGEEFSHIYRVRFVHKDGYAKWGEINAVSIDWEGKPAVLGMISDIDERVAAQQALEESEERYRLLVENTNEAIGVLQDGVFKFANPKLSEITGYTNEELISKSFLELVHPDDHQKTIENHMRRMAGDRAPNIYQFRAIDKAGNTKWAEINAVFFNWEGRPATLALLNDVTARVTAQQALEESEAKYRMLVEGSADMIFSLDPQGNFTYLSPAAERLSGYRPEEVIGRSFAESIVPEDLPDLLSRFKRTLAGATEGTEFRTITKDGSIRWVHTASRATHREGKLVGITGIMSDITERKRAEEALKRSEALLKDTQELAGVGGWEYDVAAKKATWTDQLYRIHELPIDPTLDHVAVSLKCYLPEDKPVIEQAFRKCIDEGVPYDLELPFVTYGGNRRWIRTTGRPVSEGERIVRVLGNIVDITERREAEESLRASEEKYHILVDNANEAIGVVRNGVWTFANPKLLAVTGFTAEELLGKPFFDLVHPDDRQMAIDRQIKRMKGEEVPTSYQLRFLKKSGEVGWTEMSVNVIQWEGKPATLALMIDITEARRAQDELRASEEKFRLLTEKTNDLIYTSDLNLKDTYVSPSVGRILGFTPEEYLARSPAQKVTPESLARASEGLAQYLAQEREAKVSDPERTPRIELEHYRKDGSTVWLEHQNSVMRDTSGNIVGLHGVARDVTERKLADEKLRQQERRFRAMTENSSDGILVLDREGEIKYASRGAMRLVGIDEYTPGQRVFVPIHPEDAQAAGDALRQCIITGKPTQGESRARHKDGSWRIIEARNTNLLDDPAVEGVIVNMRDITERKQVEEALAESEAKYRNLFESAQTPVEVISMETGLVVLGNKAMAKLFGVASPDDLIGLDSMQYLRPEDIDAVANRMVKTFTQAGWQEIMELQIRTHDGRWIWVTTSASPTTYQGKPAIVTTLLDITERKLAEQKLKESEAIYRALFENTQTAMEIISGETGLVVMANQAIARMFGFSSPGEMIGRDSMEYLRPEDRQWVAEGFARILADKDFVEPGEVSALTQDGRWIWISAMGAQIEYQGKPAFLVSILDLTSRKQAEEKLRKSEERFRQITENMLDAVTLLDLDGIVQYASPSHETLVGYKPEDLVGKATLDLTHPDDVDKVKGNLAGILEKGHASIQYRFRHSDGHYVWGEASVTVIRDNAGNASGYVIAGHDITERKAAEEALKDSERRLTDIIEFLPDATFVIDLEGKVIAWNRAIEEMTGVSKKDMLGKGERAYSVPFYGHTRPALVDFVFASDSEIEEKYRIVQRKGDSLWVESWVPEMYEGRGAYLSGIAAPLRDSHGNIIGAIESIRDVTDRKKAEEAVRASEEKYRLLLARTNDLVWTMDLNLRITYMSPSVENVLGFTAEECVGSEMAARITPESLDQAESLFLEQLERDGKPGVDPRRTMSIEIEYYRKDGSTVWMEALVGAIRDEDGVLIGIHGVSRDITARKVAQEGLRASEEKYRLLTEKTNDIIWTTDLELRNTYLSPSVERILGYTPEERMRVKATDQMTPESAARAAEALREHVALEAAPEADPQRMLRIEVEYYRKDGSTVWLENQVSGIRDAKGTLVGFHGVARDISERRKVQAALEESERRYRLLAESATDIIFTADADLRLTYASPSVARVLGYRPEEIAAISFDKLLTPASLAVVVQVHKDDMTTEERKRGAWIEGAVDVEMLRKDGSTVWMEAAVNAIRDEDGRITGYHGACRDITARRQAQEALRESEAAYRVMFDQSPNAMAVSRLTGEIVDVNRRFMDEQSLPLTDILGKSATELGAVDSGQQSAIAQEFERRGGRLEQFETRLWSSARGQWHDVLISASVISMKGEPMVITVVNDITARRRAEEALRASEERNRLLVENANEGIAVVQDGLFKFVNPKFSGLASYTAEELVGHSFTDFIHPDDRQMVADRYVRRLKGEEVPSIYQYRYIHKSGEAKWAEMNAVSFDWEGKPAVLAMVNDITERREAAEALRKSEERYRQIANCVPDLIWMLDLNGRFTYANPAVERTHGWTVEEYQNRSIEDLVTRQQAAMDREMLTDEMAKAASPDYDRNSIRTWESEELRKDGSVFRAEVSAALLWGEDGKPSGVIGISRDISERKRMEERIQESEQLFRSIVESSHAGIYTADNEFRFTYVNDRLCETSGYSREELLGMDLRRLIAEESLPVVTERFVRRQRDEEVTPYYEFVGVRKDGEKRWFESRATVVPDAAGKPRTIGQILDITERKRAEEASRESEKKFTTLFESANDAIFINDTAGHILEVNRVACERLGYTREELLAMTVADVDSPEHADHVPERMKRLVEEGQAIFETAHRTKDGGTVPTEVSARMVDFEGQQVILTIARDITEREQAERALRESEERYRMLAENASDVIWTTDMNLKYTYNSPSKVRQSGYTPEEFSKLTVDQVLTPETLPIAANAFAEQLALEQVPGSDPHRKVVMEVAEYHKNGTIVWTEATASFLRDKDGKAIGVIGISRDITERKKAAAALEESERRYRLLAENASDIIWTTDLNLKITYVSPAVTRLLGYTVEEAIAGPFLDRLLTSRSSSLMAKTYKDDMAGEESTPGTWRERAVEIEVVSKDGSVFWLEAAISGTRDSNGRLIGFQGACRDVTGRKQAEEAMRASEERYRLVFENSPVSIWEEDFSGVQALMDNLREEGIADLDAYFDQHPEAVQQCMRAVKIVDVNQAALALHEAATKEELLGGLADRLTSESSNAFREELVCLWSGGKTMTRDGVVRTFAGEPRHVTVSLSVAPGFEESLSKVLVTVIDITDRKLAEESMRESEARFRRLSEATEEGIAIHDMGVIVEANEALSRMSGYSLSELVGMNAERLVTPQTWRVIAEHMSAGIEEPYEGVGVRKDGSAFWCSLVGKAYRYKGKMMRLGAFRDITKRKRAEEDLQREEKRFRAIAENSSDVIVMVNPDGSVAYESPATQRVLGYSAEERLGASVFSLIHPDDLHLVTGPFQLLLQNPLAPVQRAEIRLRHKDGSWRIIEASGSGVVRGSTVEGVVITLHDVTERRLAEEALRKNEAMLASLLEATPAGVGLLVNRVLLKVNKALSRITGYSEQEMLGNTSRMLYPDEEEYQRIGRELYGQMEREGLGRLEARLQRKDGALIHVILCLSPFDPQDPSAGVCATILDITDRKRAEEALEERLKELRCIAGISRLAEKPEMPVEDFVREAVSLLPSAWQYPKICSARIRLDSKEFRTAGFRETKWSQSADIRVDEKRFGTVTVCYSKEMPKADEGPFLKEERDLINTVADFLGHVIQHRQMEEALRASEEKYRSLVEHASEIIFSLDTEGRVTYLSPSVEASIGYKPEEFVGRFFKELVVPEDLPDTADRFQRTVAGERGRAEFRVVAKNGDMRVIQTSSSIMTQKGVMVGLTGVGMDVTERKRMERLIQEQRDLAHQLSGVSDLDQGLRICLEAAMKVAGMDSGGVYLVDKASGGLRLMCHAGLSAKFVKAVSYYEPDSPSARLVYAGNPVYAQHQRLGVPLDPVRKKEGLRALAVIPFLHEGKVLGFVNVASHTVDEVPGSVRGPLETICFEIGGSVARLYAQESLRESEERYRLLAENATDVIWMMDMNLRYTYISPSTTRVTGFSVEEAMSLTLEETVTPASYETISRIMSEELAAEEGGEAGNHRSRVFEAELKCKDGSTAWVEIQAGFLHDASGKPSGILGVSRDISERRIAEEEIRKAHAELEARVEQRTAELREANDLLTQEIRQRQEAQEKLEESESRYRELVESANSVILELDTKGRITFFNRFAQEFFGFPESEILGRHVVGTIAPDVDSDGKDRKEMTRDLAKHPENYLVIENEGVRRNGERVWISWTNKGLYDTRGRLRNILCIGMDRTEQRRTAEMLAQQMKEKAAADERQRLARDLHDAVTQTLFSASLIAEVLPRLWRKDREEGERRLEELRRLTRGALAEMRMLLLELRPAALGEVGLVDLLRQMVEATTVQARLKVEFTVEGTCSAPPEVQVALYRVAQEAVNNVAKHSGAKEAKINLTCRGDTVDLTVSDNGSGFDPKKVLPRSLGLRIMQERTEAIGATLRIEGRPGRGTRIRARWTNGKRKGE